MMNDQNPRGLADRAHAGFSTLGRSRASFADDADIEELVATLERYERGELTPDQWRAFRDTRGVLIQPQRDMYKLRVKVPQGVLSAAALCALADCCETFSRGVLHTATRQDIQIHFVTLKDAVSCMRHLASVGLTTRGTSGNSVQNVVGCPFAGVCPSEAFDVSPYAEAVTRHFLRHPLTSTLPRKFKIAFGGCGKNCVGEPFHDMGLSARVRQRDGIGERGFRVTVGGGMGVFYKSGWLLYDFLPADRLLSVAEAVMRVFHRHGNRGNKAKARLKYLILKLGWEAWKRLYDEQLEAILATGGERLPFEPQTPTIEDAPSWARLEPPSETEVARRAASAKVRGPGILPDAVSDTPQEFSRPRFDHFCRTNVRTQAQNGYLAVTAYLSMAALTAEQLRIVADLALAYGDGSVRTTPRQNLVIRWVKREDLPELYKRLDAAGLGRPGADTIADVTSCPGRESCRFAVTQARGLAQEISLLMELRPDLSEAAADASIMISGCPYGCAHHPIATLGFQGGLRRLRDGTLIPQYQLLVGGWVDSESAHFGRRSVKIPVRRVTEASRRLLEWYRDTRGEGETASQFFRRVDLGKIEELLADVCSISPRTVRPEDYVDFGREDETSIG